MKKILFIALFLLFPTLSYAYIYERSPSGTEIISPVTFSVSVDDWIELFPYGFYNYICVYGENTGVYYHSNEVIPSSSLSGVFTMDLPVGVSLNTIALFTDDTIEGCLSEFATDASNDLENGDPIFVIVDGLLYSVANTFDNVTGLSFLAVVGVATTTLFTGIGVILGFFDSLIPYLVAFFILTGVIVIARLGFHKTI